MIPEWADGGWRSMHFWYTAFPIWAQYKALEYYFTGADWTVAEPYFEYLHNRHAPAAEKLCLDLRGFYLKGAQVASTRDDLLPPQYLAFCKRFQDQVPSELPTREEISAVLCDALGVSRVSDVFSDFDYDQPIGAASIGVVHRATLHNGKAVAVKLQFPRIEERFKNDIQVVKSFCRFALPSHLPFLNELERQFLTEFDYVAEAKNLNDVRRAVLPRWRAKVYIPYVVEDLCRKNVMVMEVSASPRACVRVSERACVRDGVRNGVRGGESRACLHACKRTCEHSSTSLQSIHPSAFIHSHFIRIR